MTGLLAYLRLPSEVSPNETAYLRRLNKVALWFLWMHVPGMMIVAALAGTGVARAALFTSIAMVGPTLVYFTAKHPRSMGYISGFATMVLGGVLVHFGQGPMQIEMHFYFFVLIALLAVFANPVVILIAAGTVAAHHLVMWLLIPASVFNHAATIWTVVVHALFVVLESVAAIFVARSFFDSTIRLEQTVIARTAALDAQTRDLRMVLDHVRQGFVTVGLDGAMSKERSAILETWLGAAPASGNLIDYLDPIDANVAGRMWLGLDEIKLAAIPLESSLGVLPHRLIVGERTLQVAYEPIGEKPDALLVVMSDITAELERDRAQQASRELVAVLERVGSDRHGLVELYEEAGSLVHELEHEPVAGPIAKRRLHTLKGNAALYGVESVAAQCELIETRIASDGKPPTATEIAVLVERWREFASRLELVLGNSNDGKLEICDDDLAAVLAELRAGGVRRAAELIESWRLDPVDRRFQRLAEQGNVLAARLGKDVAVAIRGNGVRLDRRSWSPFWSSFVHVIRNAIDHGIEAPEERVALGKPARGALELSASRTPRALTIEVRDDGRGIDWAKVREKAAALGLANDTPRALTDALFSDGLSTRDEVSETSGRGVGLAALRQAVAANGGEIAVESQPARGTRMTFVFPIAS